MTMTATKAVLYHKASKNQTQPKAGQIKVKMVLKPDVTTEELKTMQGIKAMYQLAKASGLNQFDEAMMELRATYLSYFTISVQ